MTTAASSFAITTAITSLLAAILLEGGEGVRIKSLHVPEAVQNGSKSSVVLDCDYTMERDEVGLVVKWFLDDLPDPVYQWIPKQIPQDLGRLKGRLNLEYRASEDEDMMHRALQIINPTTELAGIYSCVVSTFDGEATASKKMIIYVPEKSLQLTSERNQDKLIVRCAAEGVFPQPNITIISTEKGQPGAVDITSVNGLYNAETSLTLDLEEIATLTTFECVLRIPEANYTNKRSTVYSPESNSGSWTKPDPLLWATTLLALLSSRL